MSAAQARYRRTLRWYPASWREVNEDVVLSTLLDVAEAEGRDRPTVRERVNLAGHGIRASVERGLPRSIRDRASALALGTGAAFATVYLFFVELDRFAGSPQRDDVVRRVFGDGQFGWGPFASSSAIVMLAWLVALVAGMLGFRRIMLVTLAASWGAALAGVAGGTAPWAVMRPSVTVFTVLGLLVLIVALGDPGRSRRQVGWTAISAAVALVVFVGLILPTIASSHVSIGRYFLELTVNLYEVAAVLALLMLAAALLRRGEWFVAMLLAALPWIPVLLWEVVYLDSSDGWGLAYALILGIIIGVPTVEWLRRRVRTADDRIRENAAPVA